MAELSQDQLRELCAALGWQGGTYHQVLVEIQRLKAPTISNEREAFEEWYVREVSGCSGEWVEKDDAGRYLEKPTDSAWQAWHERATLASGVPGTYKDQQKGGA